MLQMIYQRFSLNIYSEGRLQEKYALSASVHQYKMIEFYFEGRQQDESNCHWHDPPRRVLGGREPPQCVDPFSFLVQTEVK